LEVGNPGDAGAVEISDMVVTTQGGSAAAIGMYLSLHWMQAFADLTDFVLKVSSGTSRKALKDPLACGMYMFASAARTQ
jgi:hypothetical protein